MKAFLYFTRGRSTISNLIVRVTAPKLYWECAPSHVGIGFEGKLLERDKDFCDAAETMTKCAEAHADDSGASGEEGFAGWFPWDNVEQWVQAGKGRTAWKVYLPLDVNAALDLFNKTEHHLGMHDYDKKQIAQMWAHWRIKLPVPRNPAKVVCSEIVSRLVYPTINIPRIAGVRGFDKLSPYQVEQAALTMPGAKREGLIHGASRPGAK